MKYKKKKKSVKFAIEFSKHKNKFMKNFSRESFFSTVNEIIYFLWFNYEYISVEAFKWNSCTFWLNTLDLPVFRIVNYNTNWIKRYNKSIGQPTDLHSQKLIKNHWKMPAQK